MINGMKLIGVAFIAVCLSGCIGIRMDVDFNADGSGRVNLEYRLAKGFESLGKLDGNESWPPFPVGRSDFERGIARISGLELLNWAVKEDGRDIVYTARISFANTRALVQFFDYSGTRALQRQANGRTYLSLTLSDGSTAIDEGYLQEGDFTSLLSSVFIGYAFELYFNASSGITLPGADRVSKAIPGSALLLDSSGKKASFVSPMEPLLFCREAVSMELSF
ncbi:hypothetical protein FACS1894200_07490 [Spirochaetia bacterium]|nr:hypothetical protein FACS1894200_07490 [Spirochaetia bacterium]